MIKLILRKISVSMQCIFSTFMRKRNMQIMMAYHLKIKPNKFNAVPRNIS